MYDVFLSQAYGDLALVMHAPVSHQEADPVGSLGREGAERLIPKGVLSTRFRRVSAGDTQLLEMGQDSHVGHPYGLGDSSAGFPSKIANLE